MDKKPDLPFSRQLMRDGERHFDYFNFDDLLLLATETCLTDTPVYEFEEESLSSEQILLSRLGLRGLNLAFDTIAFPRNIPDYSCMDDDGKDLIGTWFPL